MYNIKTLNNISSKGLERLSSNLFAVDEEGAQPDGILVRSAAMHDMELPQQPAGHRPCGRRRQQYPGGQMQRSGHRGVQHAGRQRQCGEGAGAWAGWCWPAARSAKAWSGPKRLAGQGDSHRQAGGKGQEPICRARSLRARRLGVVGLGAIGVKVANMATHLGMEVLWIRPVHLSVEACLEPFAQRASHCVNLSDLYRPVRLYHPAHSRYGRIQKALMNDRPHCPDEARRAHPELCPRRAGELRPPC